MLLPFFIGGKSMFETIGAQSLITGVGAFLSGWVGHAIAFLFGLCAGFLISNWFKGYG